MLSASLNKTFLSLSHIDVNNSFLFFHFQLVPDDMGKKCFDLVSSSSEWIPFILGLGANNK